MRNIFDQYTQWENRVTHSLASALHQDSSLLRSFLAEFGPRPHPNVKHLTVIEQGVPGKTTTQGEQDLARGLPDALIYDEGSAWALIIESKVADPLAKNQLRRHSDTIQRCGFEDISGLTITVHRPTFSLGGWRMATWTQVYSWASANKRRSVWATLLVEYFHVAEGKMIQDEYLKDGTITEFSGISFDPYSYLECKRIVRLLTKKIRDDKRFIKTMRLDASSARAALTNQAVIWDYIPFRPQDKSLPAFNQYPHCTISIGPESAQSMITFPNGMKPALRKRLHGESFEIFCDRLRQASEAVTSSLKNLKAYRPTVRLMQRRYPSQRAVPMMDGRVEFDLRATFGDENPQSGPAIKQQVQWARAAYDLLSNKRSNIEFQIGVEFYYRKHDELAHKDADEYFKNVIRALRPFVGAVID